MNVIQKNSMKNFQDCAIKSTQISHDTVTSKTETKAEVKENKQNKK